MPHNLHHKFRAIPDGTTRMAPWVCSVHVCSRMFLLNYPRLGWGVGHCLSASGRPEAAIVPASSILLSKPQRRLHRASESVQCVWRAALSKKKEKICALLHSVRPIPCTVVVISCLGCRGRAQSSLAKVSRRRVECLSLPPSESIAHAGSRLHWAVTKAPGIASDATAATTLIQRSLLTSRALPRSACWSSSSECSLLNSALKQTLRASRHAFGPLLPCFSNSYTSLCGSVLAEGPGRGPKLRHQFVVGSSRGTSKSNSGRVRPVSSADQLRAPRFGVEGPPGYQRRREVDR